MNVCDDSHDGEAEVKQEPTDSSEVKSEESMQELETGIKAINDRKGNIIPWLSVHIFSTCRIARQGF